MYQMILASVDSGRKLAVHIYQKMVSEDWLIS